MLDLKDLEAKLAAATKLPWSCDTHEIRHADTTYACAHGPDGKVIFDTANSESMCISCEDDEGAVRYIDLQGLADLELAVSAVNSLPDLLTRLKRMERMEEALTTILNFSSQPHIEKIAREALKEKP